MKAIVYLGFKRETPVEVKITKKDIKQGYGYAKCFECEGTGFWDYGPPGTEGRCINCKGTGKVLINM